MSGQVVLDGTVESIIYQNEENGYTVFSFDVQEDSELVCIGYLPALMEGELLKVSGSYVVHPTYGQQLSVESYEKIIPTTVDGIEKYLSSGVVKGIKARLAKKIVKRFGEATLDVIEQRPEQLAEISGITLEKARAIGAVFHEQAEMRRVLMYLQQFEISAIFAHKIHKRYKDATFDIVKNNPFKLAEDIVGIGFKKADMIAHKVGIESDSVYRVRAGIRYTLAEASNNGHVFLPKTALSEMAAELLAVPGELIENNLLHMQMERNIMQEKTEQDGDTSVYLNYFYYAESYVAKKLLELSHTGVGAKRNKSTWEMDIEQVCQELDIILAADQKRAVLESMNHGVLVITGGPGTGKTTTVNTVIRLLQNEGHRIELAAPTGRAAKRLSEATSMDAKTIHRLLEINFREDNARVQSFGKDEDNPLETDVLIVDESSMIDILLMNSLLKALATGTKLILVGDVDQLPSVGPGNVLKDIIASGQIKTVVLKEIFRQAAESAIVTNAHRINEGVYPVINEKDKDFFFVKRTTPELVVSSMVELIMNRLPGYIPCDRIQDIQVLTPMRKTPLGVLHLNQVLQQHLNPPGKNKREREVRSIVFREGDKVMQIKNNYNTPWRLLDAQGKQIDEGLGVFNGDTGIIRVIDAKEDLLTVLFDDNRLVEYESSQLDELELAYAITIHKSQGSEYKIVIIPIHSGPPMLMTRNLLYTGVTRAKELAVIVGLPESMNRMVDNNREINRYSSLAYRMAQLSEFMAD